MVTPSQLIFLPGAGGLPQFWTLVAERISNQAAKVLLGWPGFGQIPVDPKVVGISDLVEMVIARIDQPTALIAQSMGGVIAIQAALRRPELVTHLVLVATSGGLGVADLQGEDWRPAFVAANPGLPRWFVDYRADLSPDFGRVRAPALLLWGDADSISPVAVGERLRRELPRACLHVVCGGGHDLAHAFAAEVALLIDAHLALPDVAEDRLNQGTVQVG